MRARLRAVAGAIADRAGRVVVRLPGVAALACTVAGVWVLTGRVGWALIAAVPFLLLADRRMPS